MPFSKYFTPLSDKEHKTTYNWVVIPLQLVYFERKTRSLIEMACYIKYQIL